MKDTFRKITNFCVKTVDKGETAYGWCKTISNLNFGIAFMLLCLIILPSFIILFLAGLTVRSK